MQLGNLIQENGVFISVNSGARWAKVAGWFGRYRVLSNRAHVNVARALRGTWKQLSKALTDPRLNELRLCASRWP